MDLSTIQPIVDTAVPIIVTGVGTWLVTKVVALCPAAASFLTAARVQQAEEDVSNILTSQAHGVLNGTVSLKAEASAAVSNLSKQARTAMSAQGTTNDMLAARAIGNALIKIGSLPMAVEQAKTPASAGIVPTTVTPAPALTSLAEFPHV